MSIPQRHHSLKSLFKIDVIMFVCTIALATLAVGLTKLDAEIAHRYWSLVIATQAILSSIWGLWRLKALELTVRGRFMIRQTVIWGSTFITVAILYLFMYELKITPESTGLLILLALAMATFVNGMLVSWKLYVVGLFLLFSLLLAIYIKLYFLFVIFLGVIITIMVVMIALRKRLDN